VDGRHTYAITRDLSPAEALGHKWFKKDTGYRGKEKFPLFLLNSIPRSEM
jgi:hypothetical protein